MTKKEAIRAVKEQAEQTGKTYNLWQDLKHPEDFYFGTVPPPQPTKLIGRYGPG